MWELRIMPVDYWVRHPKAMFADATDKEIELIYFKKKSDAMTTLGFKRMKKREAGCYERVANGYDYTLSKF